MIIDSITHITPNGKWFNTHVDASESRLLKEIEDEKIKSAVVVALADYIDNEFVLKSCNKHKGILLPGGSFNPSKYRSPEDAKNNFRHEFFNSEFKVLKLHPRLNHYDPLDPRCLAILEELSSWENKIPVWIDTFFHNKEIHMQKGVVESIHFLVTNFPKITFTLLHGGGSYLLNVYEAIRDCENAYLDFSFALKRYRNTSLWNNYKFLVGNFDKRIIFGSDFPEVSIKNAVKDFEDIRKELSGTENLSLKFENIYANNINRILNLHGAGR